MIDTWMAELPHGIRLSCRSAGLRGRPVLLFLHGFPEAAFVWDEVLLHFSQPEHGGFRCVAPNLRGYEKSSAPMEASAYRPKPLMEDLAALIALECGTSGELACLIAHDWGGAVAWNLASAMPELMQRLAIINSPHPQTFLRELKDNPAQQTASAYMNFLIRPDAESLLAADDFSRLWPFFDAMGASGSGAPSAPPVLPDGAGWMNDALRAQYRAVWSGAGSSPGAGLTGGLNYYRASSLRPSREGDPACAAVTLPRDAFTIPVPTLVLWAMQDHALLPALTEGLDQWVPDLTITRIERATHWIVHEQPARVVAELTAFLSKS
ncbi:alpha/beta fold hydrolase [Ottowia thiooxydans]|uniref:alpha/beta fold hydrolase n=1 Tax=Ottowia thiooxydans TaxID=219182 RepID=UPI00040479F2|nr:alpha/beta fold hydrolase [Ottowia thiooxydans]